MRNIEFINTPIGGVRVGNLAYGTVLTEVKSNPKCIYMKVDKTSLGQGLHFGYPGRSSILVNLKTGGLRAVPGSEDVIVLEEHLTLKKVDDTYAYRKF